MPASPRAPPRSRGPMPPSLRPSPRSPRPTPRKEQTASALARSEALKQTGNATDETLETRQASARQAAARLQLAEQCAGRRAGRPQPCRRAAARMADPRGTLRDQGADGRRDQPPHGAHRRHRRIVGRAAVPHHRGWRHRTRGECARSDARPAQARHGGRGDDRRVASPFKGHVRLVSPEVNATTRLGRVRIALDKAPGLNIGAFGRGNRRDSEPRPACSCRNRPCSIRRSGPSVQVVADGTVANRAVAIGLRTDKQVEIVKGVGDGRCRGRYRRHLRARRRQGDAGPGRAERRPAEGELGHVLQHLRLVDPPARSLRAALRRADGARLGVVQQPADHQVSEHRRADHLGDGDPVRRRAGRARDAGRPQGRGRGLRHLRRQAHHLDR